MRWRRQGSLRQGQAAVRLAIAATAVTLVSPATPASADAQVPCRVSQWICITTPLSAADTHTFRVATFDRPGTFVIVRDLERNGEEVLREFPNVGNRHDHQRRNVYSHRYQAELHCPSGCPGALLHFSDTLP